MTESRTMGRISMRSNKISGSRKPDLFLTKEKTSIYRFLAQTVSPLSGITKGTSLYRGFRKSWARAESAQP